MSLIHEERQKINPGLSAVLSFLFNGVGQIYNGQIKKGLIIIACSSIGTIFTLIGAILSSYYLLGVLLVIKTLIWGLILFVVGTVIIAVLGIYSIYDAYNAARKNLLE